MEDLPEAICLFSLHSAQHPLPWMAASPTLPADLTAIPPEETLATHFPAAQADDMKTSSTAEGEKVSHIFQDHHMISALLMAHVKSEGSGEKQARSSCCNRSHSMPRNCPQMTALQKSYTSTVNTDAANSIIAQPSLLQHCVLAFTEGSC